GTDLFDALFSKHRILKDTEKLAALVSINILNALSYLEKESIAHRDIKPENIMVDFDGNMFLIDFGLSESMLNTRCINPSGTQGFLSPECFNRDLYCRESLSKSDIWSLGVTLLNILTRQNPFERWRLMSDKFDASVFNDAETLIDSVSTMISTGMKDLLMQMLTMDCDKRPRADDLLNVKF
ncbi:kinase-like protein, partial [Rozella allomycis CSF55]